MTGDSFPTSLTGRIIELAKILGAISIITGFFGGAWAVTWGPVKDLMVQWENMQIDIADLKRDMVGVKGDDRVIRETPGLTYISEPVYEGEKVVFNFVAERTRLGEPCILEYSQAIFTDMMNVPTPGERRVASRQIGDSPSILRPGFRPPENIRPGRVTMYLILAYECDGKTVFDRTSTAAFELLAGPRPSK